MGTQLPLPIRGQSPQFWAHVYCGQTAGWIKMALGVEVGFDPGHVVLDGMGTLLPSPTRSRTSSNFGPYFYCGQTAVCVRIPLGTEVGLSLGDIVLDVDPVPSPLEGHNPPPNFRPMSVVSKRLDGLRCHMV